MLCICDINLLKRVRAVFREIAFSRNATDARSIYNKSNLFYSETHNKIIRLWY